MKKLNENFYKLQKKFHPDLYYRSDLNTKKKNKEKIYIINEGYRKLKNPLSRISHLFVLNNIDYKNKKKYPLKVELLENQFQFSIKLENLKSNISLNNELSFFIKKKRVLIQNFFKKISLSISIKKWNYAVSLFQEIRFLFKLLEQANEIKKIRDLNRKY
ncbi:Fe-S protein assembly co-chaperone HscB [Buchnera aphidicola (Mindarus keteleerifoliae)]|uniref:Fe-S protein assembly co-chaperone HscB n=1 Tax=Buchnera aphidicola TaxID=9 RepID=UPI0031B6C9F1